MGVERDKYAENNFVIGEIVRLIDLEQHIEYGRQLANLSRMGVKRYPAILSLRTFGAALHGKPVVT